MIPRHTERILLVRLSARGDVVFASPLAGAIKRAYPHVHLAWVAEERTADVIEHNPWVDEVIVWERQRWKRLWKAGKLGQLAVAIRSFVTALRAKRFDVAIDAQGLLRSGAVAFLSGAPVRIGLASREGSRLLMTHVVELGGDKRRISSEYEHLARRLNLEVEPFRIEIPRSPEDFAFVEEMVREHDLGGGFVVAAPFTTRSFKHWFEERWSRLLSLVEARTGKKVVVLGGPADREAAERILSQVDGGVVDLVGRTSLAQAAAMVARSALVVGVDTGLSHMAHGYGRPSVLLFGSNTPYLNPPLPVSQILHSGRSCSPCRGKLVCEGRIDCMADFAVEDVLDAIGKGLSMQPASEGSAA